MMKDDTKSTKSSTQSQAESSFFQSATDIANSIQQRDHDTLRRVLSVLKDQLIEATKVRVEPAAKHTRPLVEYIQSCDNDVHDLIDLWDYQFMNNIQTLECLVLDVLGLFMRLCSTPIIRPFGLRLVESILANHMKYIYRGISSPRVLHCVSTFKLLASICSLGQTAVKDLFQTFNFQAEGFLRSSRYRQQKKKSNPNQYIYDLRTHFVRFVLSFFIHGDAEVKKQVLGVKNLLGTIFNGIDQDAYKLIQEILSVTREHLILDNSVQRAAKLNAFSSYILEQVAKVYARTEPEVIGPDETGIPAELAHEFLISVCTVRGVGLCLSTFGWYRADMFADDSTRMDKSDKVENRVLAKFLTALKPADDLRQQELVRKILQACPELVQGYWQHSSMSLEPRLSSKWLANMTLFQKVIRLPVPSLYYSNTKLYPLVPPVANTILDSILPNAFGRAVSSRGLKHASPLVTYVTMLVLSAAFIKYGQVQQALSKAIASLEEGNADAAAIKSWRKCLKEVQEELRRRMPDILTVITVYQESSSDKDNKQEKEQEDDITTQRQMLQDAAFRLIRYFQQYLPEAMMESMVDPSNFIIPADILSARAGSLIHLLELLLHLPSFKWTNKTSSTSFSHITTLLTLYLETPYDYIKSLTGKLINNVLADSFMFQHDLDEVPLWINALPKNYIKSSEKGKLNEEQNTVLQFLDECINRFSKSQYRYTDQMLAMVRAVNEEQVNNDKMRFLMGSSSEIYPFSPLLLTVFQHIKTFKGDKHPVFRFITSLVRQLNSKQRIPHYLDHLCTKELTEFVDDRAAEKQVGIWTHCHMIQQALLCLNDNTISEAMDIDQDASSLSAVEDRLSALISEGEEEEIEDTKQCQQQAMTDILRELPVKIMQSRLSSIVSFCKDKLGWTLFGPLLDYFYDRHPLAGSLFGYPDIEAIQSMDDDRDDNLLDFLKSLPFDVVFYNTWRQCDANPLARSLLKHAMQQMEPQQLRNAVTLILQKLSMLLVASPERIVERSSVTLAFELLRHALAQKDIVEEEKEPSSAIQTLILEHPVIEELTLRLTYQVRQLSNSQIQELDVNLFELAAAYTDLFGYGSNASLIVESLIGIDCDTLEKYHLSNGQDVFKSVSKLLIDLVGKICQRKNDEIPDGAFDLITRIWQAQEPSSGVILKADILGLFESAASSSSQSSLRAASVLLEACSELVVRHLLAGQKCAIEPSALREACARSSVDVSQLVLDTLKKEDIPMSPALVDVLCVGFNLLSGSDDRAGYVLSVVNTILRTLAKDVRKVVSKEEFYEKLAENVLEVMDVVDWTILDAETVRDYVLNTLLDNLDDAPAIRFTGVLVKHVYNEYTKDEPLETYIRRILDHERYQSLTDPGLDKLKNGEVPENKEQRQAIIELVYVLNSIRPTILATHHGLLDQLLTSYSATTSVSDQYILEILRSCEREEKSLLSKMLMWGPGSDKARQAHAQSGTLFTADTVTLETLGLVDPAIMKYTFTHFPLDAHLSERPVQKTTEEGVNPIMYDYAFFIPLFANLVNARLINCRTFIECNALGLILVCLSASDDHIRMIGFQTLDKFYEVVQSARFNEQAQVVFALDALRNSIKGRAEMEIPPRIPPSVTVSMAHALSVLLQPAHYMYPHFMRWLTAKPEFDLKVVPMFTTLFLSATPTNQRERLWLLRVLSSSLQTYEDYKIFSRNQVWNTLGSFYLSALADPQSKRAVIEIYSRAFQIPGVARSLVQYHGFLVLIQQILAAASEQTERQAWLEILTAATNTIENK